MNINYLYAILEIEKSVLGVHKKCIRWKLNVYFFYLKNTLLMYFYRAKSRILGYFE